ncbi:hypothetical protein MMC07_005849 [Pseudocyphellaria aurata]|nr:hypothetical protein [Pseudocyphellaria aurata]
MAAGKKLRLKTEDTARLRRLSEYTTEEGRNLNEFMIMASAPPDQSDRSPPKSAPELLSSSTFTFPNPSSLPSQQMLPHPSVPLTAPMSAHRRRKTAKHAVSTLKRSASTPNVRGGESGMSVADKRRNKLGYHRTSVACGMCSSDRVKDEADQSQKATADDVKSDVCLPQMMLNTGVQTPQVERRPRPGSKLEHNGETSTSSSSSPAIGGGSSIDPIDHFHHYPPLPLSTQDYPSATASLNGDLVSPVGRGPTSHRAFDFSHQHERSHWDSPFFDHGPLSAGHSTPEDPAHAYWKLAESPVTPGFSSQFSQPPSSVPQQARDAGPGFTSLPPPRDDPGWSMHARSMSFGHVDDVSLNYHNHYHSPLPMEFRRRASDMHHPPSLQTSTNSSNTSVSEARSTPLSAPPVPSQPMHPFGVSQTWNAISGHSLMGKSEYGRWYSDPPPLTEVQEEDVGHHFSGEPGILYAGTPHR